MVGQEMTLSQFGLLGSDTAPTASNKMLPIDSARSGSLFGVFAEVFGRTGRLVTVDRFLLLLL